jgi:hypothetical protein
MLQALKNEVLRLFYMRGAGKVAIRAVREGEYCAFAGDRDKNVRKCYN